MADTSQQFRGRPIGEVFPLVYEELHRLAAGQLRHQRSDHTLQATALVNEAWVKLAKNESMKFEGRGQFLVLAAKAMRQVLVDHARHKGREKRGGGEWQRVTLGVVATDDPEANEIDLLDLEAALQELAELNEERVLLVELRFFGGLTESEAAEVLGISRREASRQWRAMRAWLWTRLREK